MEIVDSDDVTAALSLDFNLVDSCHESNLKLVGLLPLMSAEVMELKFAVNDVVVHINC